MDYCEDYEHYSDIHSEDMKSSISESQSVLNQFYFNNDRNKKPKENFLYKV